MLTCLRAQVAEMLFECYGVRSLAFGVDGLWALSSRDASPQNALVITIGHSATHILPIIENRVQWQKSMRLSIGCMIPLIFTFSLSLCMDECSFFSGSLFIPGFLLPFMFRCNSHEVFGRFASIAFSAISHTSDRSSRMNLHAQHVLCVL